MFLMILAAATAVAAEPTSNKDLIPPTFDECVSAVQGASADVTTVCDAKPYSTIHLWGPEPSYRRACVVAMERGSKWVEVRKKLPPNMAAVYGRRFEESRGQCLNPPPPEAPVPELKMIQLWD